MDVRGLFALGAVAGLVVQMFAAGVVLAADGAAAPDAAEPAAEQRANLWPFYEYRASGDELRVLTLAPWIPAGAVVKPGYTRILNVSWYRDGESGTGNAVVPLYWRIEKEKGGGLFTLVGGYAHNDDMELLGVLGPVYWRYRNAGSTTHALLWPALMHSSDAGSRDTRLLMGLAGQESSTGSERERSSTWLWPLFTWEREGERVALDTLLGDYEHTADASTTRISPLGIVTLYEDRSRQLEDGSSRRDQSIFLRLFERETRGEHTRVDAFPFIALDRDANLLQWSFLGGLVGWRHVDNDLTLRLLWIPVLDRQG